MSAQLLVVDDEPAIRDMLSRHFRYLGYRVATAADGHAALAYLAEHRANVLITDIRMPGMDGIELTARVREEYPLIRQIVITGYVNLTNAMACMQNGADALIPKPLEDMPLLERAVARSVGIIEEWLAQLRQLSAGRYATGQLIRRSPLEPPPETADDAPNGGDDDA